VVWYRPATEATGVNRLARAEFALDIAVPFLAYIAVAFAAPAWAGLYGITAWLIAVLDGFVASRISRTGTPRDRAMRVAGPVIVLASQALRDAPSLVDWAVQSAACGMGARGLAIAWVMVEKAAGEIRMGQDDFRMAIPGFLFIVGSTGVTMAALVSAWNNTHSGWLDSGTLAAATSTALLADRPRLRDLGARADDDGATVVLGIVFAWLLVSVVLMALAANGVRA
jgi:hypothetical protein